jgi:hypothetical protein
MASLKERNGKYYIQFYRGGKQLRRSLHTDNLQIAKERVRQFESAELRGLHDSLPTRTPIAEVVGSYVAHIRQRKTPKSAQTDIYYLREMFGPICPALAITSRKPSEKARKRPRKKGVDRRLRTITIQAPSFEQITTAHAARVERYKENAPEIRFLTLPQIQERLEALRFNPRLQTMVAVLIYARLRRAGLATDTVHARNGLFDVDHSMSSSISAGPSNDIARRPMPCHGSSICPIRRRMLRVLKLVAPRLESPSSARRMGVATGAPGRARTA